MPLLALKGKDNDTAEKQKPQAAAASPSASQARPTAAPRKVISRLKPFALYARNLEILQSTEPRDAQKKEALLKKAARAVDLQITANVNLTELTDLMALFTNVRSLYISGNDGNDLPLLPCPEKLESLRLVYNRFQTIQNITHYTNLRTFRTGSQLLSATNQDPNQTERLAVLTQLHNLHTLDFQHLFRKLFTLDGRASDNSALLTRILEGNPEIKAFTCTGRLTEEVVQALGTLPLRRLELFGSAIDDDKFALLPFNTLKELSVCGRGRLKNLAPLQGSHLRVLKLHGNNDLSDTLPQFICSMPHLEELYLTARLTDAQAKPLLQLSQRLHKLDVSSDSARMSAEMYQRLKDAFGKKMIER